MYRIIVNPTAGNGKAQRNYFRIKHSEFYQQIACRADMTAYDGHAEEIARQIAMEPEKPDCVIVIGGDGTLHEVMNGLYPKVTSIAFIPSGSGNDFARGCKIDKDPLAVFEKIVTEKQASDYWLGNYRVNDTNERIFVNSMGFGFDALVTERANQSFYKKLLNKFGIGTASYAIAIMQILFTFKPLTVDITIDGKQERITDCWMVTIANHPFYGGGMKIIPDARVQPGSFPVLIFHSASKWKVLALFITVFTGKHVRFKGVDVRTVNRLQIVSKKPITYQVDGQTGHCHSCVVMKQGRPIALSGANLKDDQIHPLLGSAEK
ncbi:diacylglycerol kinase family protein [Lentibacillus sp. N15]|uniref:diacylglycerol/lipid kinase family protein n=1 Tax=Lentibacillus songyuanensis TaxID=3136161 RepID=UPI0031BBAEC2